jgi:xanthine dehydrogenase accessory factor
MRDVLPRLRDWSDDGRRFALATVVRTAGSAPRKVGSVMAVSETGEVAGSVSGGCLDAAVAQAAQDALTKSEPRRLNFPESDDPLATRLLCGGESEVWVVPGLDGAVWQDLATYAASEVGFVLATRLEPFAQTVRRTGDAVCCSPLDAAVAEAYASGQSAVTEVGGEEWFMHVVRPRPRLVIVGAVHIARTLVAFARALGFETIVIDPRTAFAQFDVQPDALLHHWPQDALREIRMDRDTYAVALSHDPKIDDPAVEAFLRADVAYVGALGSPKTQEKRKDALRERGLTDAQLARIHGPVGLDIGAENPEEIALAVIAEITKVRRGRS